MGDKSLNKYLIPASAIEARLILTPRAPRRPARRYGDASKRSSKALQHHARNNFLGRDFCAPSCLRDFELFREGKWERSNRMNKRTHHIAYTLSSSSLAPISATLTHYYQDDHRLCSHLSRKDSPCRIYSHIRYAFRSCSFGLHP
jgi:hypothetical protein